jgi:hypothetical protein
LTPASATQQIAGQHEQVLELELALGAPDLGRFQDAESQSLGDLSQALVEHAGHHRGVVVAHAGNRVLHVLDRAEPISLFAIGVLDLADLVEDVQFGLQVGRGVDLGQQALEFEQAGRGLSSSAVQCSSIKTVWRRLGHEGGEVGHPHRGCRGREYAVFDEVLWATPT